MKPEKMRRRSKKDVIGRNFICGCGKRYLSYPALYTHIKTKHDGQQPEGTKTFNTTKNRRGRPKKQEPPPDEHLSQLDLKGLSFLPITMDVPTFEEPEEMDVELRLNEILKEKNFPEVNVNIEKYLEFLKDNDEDESSIKYCVSVFLKEASEMEIGSTCLKLYEILFRNIIDGYGNEDVKDIGACINSFSRFDFKNLLPDYDPSIAKIALNDLLNWLYIREFTECKFNFKNGNINTQLPLIDLLANKI